MGEEVGPNARRGAIKIAENSSQIGKNCPI